ncbi:MAG: hypothetical protein ACXWPX_08180 [Pseudobdellovibrio sp.]
MKSILLAFLFVGVIQLKVNAQEVANFSGHWIANEGKVSSTVGLNSKCSKVEIEIEQTATEILTKVYDAQCDMFGSKWGPIHQQIKDGKVYEQGEEVGTISGDTLITVSQSGSYQYAYNLKIATLPNGQKTLQSYYGTKGGVGAIVIEAVGRQVP